MKKEAKEAAELEKRAAAGVFGYPAGKSIIVDKLTPLVPPHKTFTELFVGSGAMFFSLEPAEVSAINDADPEVAGVYKAMQACTDADLKKLEGLDWKGSKGLWERLKKSKPTGRVDLIHRFLYLTRFSYGRMRGKSWDPNSDGVVAKLATRIPMARDKLKRTKIFSGDYAPPLKEYDGKDAFHFLDPPYAGYDVGIGEKKFDEGVFRKELLALKGKFLLTYGVKGKLDISGFNVRRLRQPRTIRAMRGVGGSKFLTHLLVTNYDLSKKGVAKLLKALGPGFEIDEVDSIIDHDQETGRTHVFQSRAAQQAAPDPAYLPPSEGALGLSVEKKNALCGRLVGGEPWGALDWQFDLRRPDVEMPILADLAKAFSVHGDRHLLALAMGVVAREKVEGVPVASAIVQRPWIECGLQTPTSREYFLSKGSYPKSGELVVAGVLRLEKRGNGEWVAQLDTDDLTPGVLRIDGPMPPPGVPAMPDALAQVVPPAFKFWRGPPEEARLKRDALVASGFFRPGSIAIVEGAFARVVQKTFLYDAGTNTAALADGPGWELELLAKVSPAGRQLREVFVLTGKEVAKGDSDVIYFDACDVVDSELQAVVKRALQLASPFVLAAVDSAAAREAFAKVGRPFQFVPGRWAGVDAVKRLFVASYAPERHDGIVWADVGRAGLEKGRKHEGKTFLEHAKAWVESKGLLRDDSDYAGELGKAIVRMAETFTEEGHSGSSAALARAYFEWMCDAWDGTRTMFLNSDAEYEKARGALAKCALGAIEALIAKDDLTTGDLGDAPPAQSSALEACIQDQILRDVPEAEARATCARRSKAWTIPIQKGRTMRLLKTKDERYTLCVVLAPEEEDAQKDIYDAKQIRTAAHGFMERFQNVGFMHRRLINKRAKIVESFIAPVDFEMDGEGNTHPVQKGTGPYRKREDRELVTKGTWLLAHHVLDDELWKMIKDGEITGLSIGGSAVRTPTGKSDGTKKTIDFQGLKVAIDRPKGFEQTLTLPDGTKKKRVYTVDYGELEGTLGGDREGLDVFVSTTNPKSKKVFWFVQRKRDEEAERWDFDEYKLVVGEDTVEGARKVYVAHIPERYIAAIRETTLDMVKALRGVEPAEIVKQLESLLGSVS